MSWSCLLLSSWLFVLGLACAPVAIAAEPITWPAGTTEQWHGYTRHRFVVDGCKAWVVEPQTPLPGKPWAWSLMFPEPYADRCAEVALLAKGFYFVHMEVGNTFGAPSALKHLVAFQDALVAQGLNPKAVLIGLSRGGLYAYRYAAENPQRVAAIYADAPVCDFRSWPGGKGKGTGSPKDWQLLLSVYGFKDEAEAIAYPKQPIDTLAPLAQAQVALIHVVGDADTTVPVAENTALIEERYRMLGGTIAVIHKPGVGHHPHGLDDPTPVVDFIVAHAPGR